MPTVRATGLPAGTKPYAVILAGGRSTRFGTDKATAVLGGRPMLAWLAEALVEAGFAPVISTANPDHTRFGLPVIWDGSPHAGPLYAMRDMLRVVQVPKLLLVACDMPLLSPRMMRWLWRISEGWVATGLSRGAAGVSPLPAVYARGIRPLVEAAVRQGRRDLRALWTDTTAVQIVPPMRWRCLDPSGRVLLNVNTPAEAAAAARLADSRTYRGGKSGSPEKSPSVHRDAAGVR